MRKELRATLRLAIPLVIGQLGLMLMGIVDTIVVGQYSAKDLAGVGAGSNLFWPIAIIGFGFQMGMDPLVAQNHGAKRYSVCRQILTQSLIQNILLAIPLTLMIWWFSQYHHLLGADPEVSAHATPYLSAVWPAMPLSLLFSVLQRYWQARNVVVPFTAMLVIGNIVNYFLDVALVTGQWGFPAMGGEGVGWATTGSRVFLMIWAIGFTLSRHQKNDFQFEIVPKIQKQLWKIGFPSGVHFFLEVGVFALSTFLVSTLGSREMAAHHIVLSAASFTFMVPFGISMAASVRVGNLIGERDFSGARRAGWLNIFLALGYAGISASIYLLFPHQLMRLFTPDPEVVALGLTLLIWVAIFQVGDAIQAVAAGALRGMGETKITALVNFIGHYPIGLALGATLCFYYQQSVAGLWMGLMTGLTTVAIILTWIWHRRAQTLTPGRSVSNLVA